MELRDVFWSFLRAMLSIAAALAVSGPAFAAGDPMPSWNDTAPKTAILEFVRNVTTPETPTFVPVRERVAVFDDDGTLWVEQPYSAQLAFEFDCVTSVQATHPDWSTKQPFKAALERDADTLARSGQKGFEELLAATHAGWSTGDYEATLSGWNVTTQHDRFKRTYAKLVYQPMSELITYLRANDFEIFIVSRNSVEFVRARAESAYGVRPEQIVGPSIRTKLEMVNGKPELVRLPELDDSSAGASKPALIYQRTGRKPIAVFGNSDDDLEMLQWVTKDTSLRLGVLVHHTDAEREYAYDRNTEFGRLDSALGTPAASSWIVIDMKTDWKTIFPFELK